MFGFKARWIALSLLSMGLGCAYNPQPENGKQQCYEGRCPSGYACGSKNMCYREGKVPVDPGTGGAILGTGGAIVGTGGAVVGTGGAIRGTGGAVVGTGGAITGTGGIVGTGGATITIKDAGFPGTGGVGAGGVIPTGGTVGMGGAVGVDASTSPPNTGTVVTFANGQAQGAITGFGWIAFGLKGTVTDPTCGSPVGLLTSSVSCALTNWSTTDALCVSGSAPAVASSTEYNDNWGISIGVNATPADGGVLGQSFTTVAFVMTGTASTGIRAQVHRKGDSDSISYCAAMVSGTPIPLTTFNTSCWDGAGAKLLAQDVPNIDNISVQVPSGSSAVTVTNLCLSRITFGR